jgi:hypothetical protein
MDILVKYSNQDRKESADTYGYFVQKLHAFSTSGTLSDASYKNDRRSGEMGRSQPTRAADEKSLRFQLR